MRKSCFNFRGKFEFRSELSYYNCMRNHVTILVGIQFHDSLVSYGRMISILTIYLSLNNMCQIYPSEVFFQYLVKWFHKRHFHAIHFQQYFQSLITRQFRFLTFSISTYVFAKFLISNKLIYQSHCLDLDLNGLLTRRNFWQIPGMLENYPIPK